MSNSEFIWMGGSGCFLPFLIIFNLFFGRLIFNSVRLWLGIEVLLILIFILSINIMTRKITRQFGRQARGDGKVVDIQGQVVAEEKKPK